MLMSATPAIFCFLVSKGNDIQFISSQTSKGLNAAFEKLPDLIEKFVDRKKEKV
jgi:hypothetical protein